MGVPVGQRNGSLSCVDGKIFVRLSGKTKELRVEEKQMAKNTIQLSDHFTYKYLRRFTFLSVVIYFRLRDCRRIFRVRFCRENAVCRVEFYYVRFDNSRLLLFYSAEQRLSVAIAFVRTLLFQAAAVLLFPLLFGVDGIWWSIPAAEAAAFSVTMLFLIGNRKKYGYM